MPTYTVEMGCDGCSTREVYLVEADSPEDAEENWWVSGRRLVGEIGGLEVISVGEDDEDDQIR